MTIPRNPPPAAYGSSGHSAGPAVLTRHRPLRWFLGASWWIPLLMTAVWSNVSDEWLLIHAVALVWALTSVCTCAIAAWATVTADESGVSVRYRWITRRTDLQRRWSWPEVSMLSSEDGLVIELHDGRTVHPIPRTVSFTSPSTEARDADLATFVREAFVFAEAAGERAAAPR